MSHFTPGKSGGRTSSPVPCWTSPPSLLHGKWSSVGFLRVGEVGVELGLCTGLSSHRGQQDSLHTPLLFVWPLAQIHCSVVHGVLCYEVLCWKTRTGNALVDPGALMDCPNLSKTSMGQLQLPQMCCRDVTEMDGARIFAGNHLLFSQTQLNILFLKMPWKLLIHSGFVCTILFSQSSPPCTHSLWRVFCWPLLPQLKTIIATTAGHTIKPGWVRAVEQIILISRVTVADFVHRLGFFFFLTMTRTTL